MNAGDPNFDEASRPVQTVDFVFPDDEPEPEPPCDHQAEATLYAVKCALVVMLKSPAPRTQCAALLHLMGMFASPAEAARAVHVHRSSLCRAVRRLQSELQHANHQKPQ